jgi:hypothetical protein
MAETVLGGDWPHGGRQRDTGVVFHGSSAKAGKAGLMIQRGAALDVLSMPIDPTAVFVRCTIAINCQRTASTSMRSARWMVPQRCGAPVRAGQGGSK